MTYSTVKLGEVVKLDSGFAFKSKLFGDTGGLPLARIRDVVPGFSETRYLGEYDEKYLINDGDMLIGMDGEFNLAKWRGGKALLNQRVCRVRGDAAHVLDDYLYYFLPRKLKEIETKTPAVTVKHLSAKTIREIDIPLPGKKEQKRIVAALGKVDAIRRKRQQAIDLGRVFLRSVFLDQFGDPAVNSQGFDIVSLSDLVSEGDKINYGIVQPGDNYAGGIPVVRVGDFVNGRIDKDKLKTVNPAIDAKHKRSRLRGDEVLLSCVGSIGQVALVDSSLAGANIVRAVARIRASDKVNRVWLFQYLRSSHAQRHLHKETRTVSQPTLNIGLIETTPVVLPSLEAQEKFEVVANRFWSKIRKFSESSLCAERLFGSLSQRAFAGNL